MENKAKVIDVITHDSKSGEYKLIIVEAHKFDGTQTKLGALQEKINNYLIFILDGEMDKTYPASKGKPKCIQIDYSHDLDKSTLEFLNKIKHRFQDENIRFLLNRL